MSKSNSINALASMLELFGSASALAPSNSNVIDVNNTTCAIHEIYFSPTDESEWGEDQLGKQTIEPGEQFTLSGIPCDKWDVRVVDEDGDECVVESVALCADTDRWVINDSDLLGCQAATD